MSSFIRHRRSGLLVVIIAATSLVCATPGQSAVSSVRGRFIGVWKLVSCERKANHGEVSYPYGEKPVGRLTYDKEGRMSAQLMRPGRRSYKEDLLDILDGFIAYFGTYSINESARTVTHHVQACLFPMWVGTDLKRMYEFSGNRLILEAASAEGVVRLVWEPD